MHFCFLIVVLAACTELTFGQLCGTRNVQISPSKAAATCTRLLETTKGPFYASRVYQVQPSCQCQATPAVEDHSSLIKLAKSLNKCNKCGKDNCTCGLVQGGEIINKLVDALIYTVVQKKANGMATAPLNPSSSNGAGGLVGGLSSATPTDSVTSLLTSSGNQNDGTLSTNDSKSTTILSGLLSGELSTGLLNSTPLNGLPTNNLEPTTILSGALSGELSTGLLNSSPTNGLLTNKLEPTTILSGALSGELSTGLLNSLPTNGLPTNNLEPTTILSGVLGGELASGPLNSLPTNGLPVDSLPTNDLVPTALIEGVLAGGLASGPLNSLPTNDITPTSLLSGGSAGQLLPGGLPTDTITNAVPISSVPTNLVPGGLLTSFV